LFSGRDVISDSENTVAISVSDARFIVGRWEGPVVVVVVSRGLSSVSQVVFSGPWSFEAIWRRNSPRILFNPFISGGLSTDGSVVGLDLNSRSILVLAVSLGFDVLGFSLIEVAPIGVLGKDDNILPWSWVPIWVIISFFSAFETISVSIVVLSGVDGGSSSLVQSTFSFSVSNV
jgi:hypothetical protein